MSCEPAELPGTLAPTPSQTVGPFFGFALPFPGGGDLVPAAAPGALVVRGTVRDGAGTPIPDALLEFWQPATGFGRVATDPDGGYSIRTLRPGGGVPYLSVCLFARGLLHHLYTRVYFADDTEAVAADPVLGALPKARRDTLLARQEREGVFRFDIRLQGDDRGAQETVFLDFR
jgi:protocatechuate 3,4-dioxygenase alpha subunit